MSDITDKELQERGLLVKTNLNKLVQMFDNQIRHLFQTYQWGLIPVFLDVCATEHIANLTPTSFVTGDFPSVPHARGFMTNHNVHPSRALAAKARFDHGPAIPLRTAFLIMILVWNFRPHLKNEFLTRYDLMVEDLITYLTKKSLEVEGNAMVLDHEHKFLVPHVNDIAKGIFTSLKI